MTEERQVYDIKELFEAVQLKNVLHDGKTFPDCIPKYPLDDIEIKFVEENELDGFDLKRFIEENFNYPVVPQGQFKSDTSRPIEEHINLLWDVLTRHPEEKKSGSLINLPFPYIVPGGRFREIYYWDPYFTMLGLLAHGRVEMIENMVNNFAFLIHEVGHIPNGNRTYYLSRSQPPYFAMMVELLVTAKQDENVYKTYLTALEKEYAFWQLGADENNPAKQHIVKLGDGETLNRYFDESPTPRQESYAEDFHLSQSLINQSPEELCTNIRAGAESGWDFSSRWFADFQHIDTVETINIIPVDLNCLLFKLESVLSKAYLLSGNKNEAELLKANADKRWHAILKYCWNKELGFFTDYNWVKKAIIGHVSAAGLMPLFIGNEQDEFIQSNIATIAQTVRNNLLKAGGIVTTPITSGQQWDAPNGWAPLQWISVKGLDNYGETELARNIAQRWLSLNEKVYLNTGKMMEKYDVVDIGKLAGGGEYESQDGFGWSNGVYLALKSFLKE